MPDPTDTLSSAEPQSSAGGELKASRRRLLQGGLAAAPVLMTLVSRPVLAQVCTTPSGYVSINASHPGAAQCSGGFPSYWVNYQAHPWPSPYFPTKVTGPGGHNPTDFKDAFKPKLTSNPTLLEVLQGNAGSGNSTTDLVAQYVSAALLNAASGSLTPVLTVSLVLDIWSEFANTTRFTPSSGASWDANEIVDYLTTTMTLSS
jgi:hypothetical protein